MENGQRKKKYPMSGRSLGDNTAVTYDQEAEATVYTDSAKVDRNWAKICYEIRVVHSSKDMKVWLHPALFQLFSLVMA